MRRWVSVEVIHCMLDVRAFQVGIYELVILG